MKEVLKSKLIAHFKRCGVSNYNDGVVFSPSKEQYRAAHLLQRIEKLSSNKLFLEKNWKIFSAYFADGDEISPENIAVKLEIVKGGTKSSDLFRLITLNWSIPVSEGYGRRIRFLVWDKYNNKIIGVFALGDAVFNIKSRDEYLGWSTAQRREKLVNVMDAYVLGAVPPYSNLLGGKLIASLIKSEEVALAFREKYKDSVGLISGNKKDPYLTVVTVTSALGRSSIYNRLKLGQDQIFKKIGMTIGWGHFHVSGEIFSLITEYLKEIGDQSVSSYEFGGGPNWKIRIIKRALVHLGMQENLLLHGFQREVYICEIANNATDILTGKSSNPDYSHLRSIEEISKLAKDRWIVPRAFRNPEYKDFKKEIFYHNLKE